METDRSQLIGRAVDNLRGKLVEEFLVVAAVCARCSSPPALGVRAIVALPLGVLAAFLVMQWRGINANLLSWAASPLPWARWSTRRW